MGTSTYFCAINEIPWRLQVCIYTPVIQTPPEGKCFTCFLWGCFWHLLSRCSWMPGHPRNNLSNSPEETLRRKTVGEPYLPTLATTYFDPLTSGAPNHRRTLTCSLSRRVAFWEAPFIGRFFFFFSGAWGHYFCWGEISSFS